MSNEIKEILEFNVNADYKRLSIDEMYELNQFIKQLFNYIKEKNHLIDDLDKEIERLKNQNKMTDEQIEKIFEVASEHIYKSRNEKAIEYIKENICDIDFMKKEYGNHFKDYDIETTFKDIENLLNILGGDDNE